MPGGQHAPELTNPAHLRLWNTLLAHQGETFTTSGRGSRPGKPFTYTIRGAEMFVSTRAKSITRSTILYAFHKFQGKTVNGPKAIGVHGDSYIYAVFKKLGVIPSVLQCDSCGVDACGGYALATCDMIEEENRVREEGAQENTKRIDTMPRPKGSKNKKNISTELVETVESIEERIAAAEKTIETLTADLKAKKAELKELTKLKAEAERVAAEKKAEEDKAAILAAVEASGKSVEEILELLK